MDEQYTMELLLESLRTDGHPPSAVQPCSLQVRAAKGIAIRAASAFGISIVLRNEPWAGAQMSKGECKEWNKLPARLIFTGISVGDNNHNQVDSSYVT